MSQRYIKINSFSEAYDNERICAVYPNPINNATGTKSDEWIVHAMEEAKEGKCKLVVWRDDDNENYYQYLDENGRIRENEEPFKNTGAMAKIDDKYMQVVEGCLGQIRSELERLLWNKHQKAVSTPFENSGEEYISDMFQVRAYDWGEDGNSEPNFHYEKDGVVMNVFWYKYFGRGMEGECNANLTVELLADMIDDCVKALQKEFGENKDV